MESMLASALTDAGIRFRTNWPPHKSSADGRSGPQLDFFLPDHGIYIEVKQFHSERIAKQMASAPDVIAVQGRGAVKWLCAQIRRKSA